MQPANNGAVNSAWQVQKTPAGLHRRFEFDSYEATRKFLDALSALSVELGYFPNISFGKTYVNVGIYPGERDEMSERETDYAQRVDGILSSLREATN